MPRYQIWQLAHTHCSAAVSDQAPSKLTVCIFVLHAGALLQQMPPQHLSSLELQLWQGVPGVNNGSAPAVKALSRLTGLARLSLKALGPPFASPTSNAYNAWMPALAGMTCLTRLQVNYMDGTAAYQYFPASLIDLELGLYAPFIDGEAVKHPINLGHLTALTQLDAQPGFILQAGDILPAQLQRLAVQDVRNMQPLLPLASSLQWLKIANSTTRADLLLQLNSSLTGVTQLELNYYCSKDEYQYNAQLASAAWSSLGALKAVHLGAQVMSSVALQQLRGLSKLSLSSTMEFAENGGQHSPQVLVHVLSQSPQLQELEVYEYFSRAGVQGITELCREIVGLQQLRALAVGDFGMMRVESEAVGTDALLELAGATQLTRLEIISLHTSSFALMRLLCSLSQLRALKLVEVAGCSDDHMAAVAVALPRLADVELEGVAVDDRGVVCLSQLTALTRLSTDCTDVTKAGWREAMRLQHSTLAYP